LERFRISHLFPPDSIRTLPTWRFVLHFVAPDDGLEAGLRQAMARLPGISWKALRLAVPCDQLSIQRQTGSVAIPVEVPPDRRAQPGSLEDYESDVWKLVAAMIESGFDHLFYESVDFTHGQKARRGGT
jgi:hypothetical protein